MEDYKRMYLKLFDAVTEAIDALEQAQREAEEIFISSGEPDLKLIGNDTEAGTDEG